MFTIRDKMLQCRAIFLVFISLKSLFVYADNSLLERKDVQTFINDLVVNYKFKREYLVSTLKEAKFQPNIIESMERPYEKKSWDVYKELFLTSKRIDSGVDFWNKNSKTLLDAEKKYGVPSSIIVAILGVETLYGARTGNYRVLDALTTLAFNYPKRSQFFTKELREYLLLCREQKVSPTKYFGSYAGAIGMPQFMPSSYRFYAVTSDGKGQADLMNENKDVIYSVANYFVKNGWKSGREVAEPAFSVGSSYKDLSTNTKKAIYSFNDIISHGIKPKNKRALHPEKAGIIELDTKNGSEYWLGYPNFYVITRYNTSPQYALVVYLLSKQLSEARAHG